MPTDPSGRPVSFCRVEIDGETWYRTLLAGVLICNTKNPADARATYCRLTGGLQPTFVSSLGALRRQPDINGRRINGSPVDTPLDAAPSCNQAAEEVPPPEEKIVFKTPWGADFEVSPTEWEAIQRWLSRSRGNPAE